MKSVLNAGPAKLDWMDGRGAWRDNVFVERLCRSVKYERVYLNAYDGVSAVRADIADYLNEVPDAPRVVHRVGRFVAGASRRRG